MFSRGLAVIGVVLAVLSVAGCSTKNYGRQSDLTSFEKSTMTCREIDLEAAKVQGFVEHVNEESEFDGRSVLSFLGDFGIGNMMERQSAMDSATKRLAELNNARSIKCNSDTAAVSAFPSSRSTAPAPAASPTPSMEQQIYELQQEKGISYEEYQYRYRRITGQHP